MLSLSGSLTLGLGPHGSGGGAPAPDNILLADNGDFFTDDDGNLLENA